MQDDQTNTRYALYEKLRASGFALPSFPEFDAGLNDPNTRSKLYERLRAEQFQLPDPETWDKQLAPQQSFVQVQPPMSKEEIAAQVGSPPFLRELEKNIRSPFSRFVGDTPIGKQAAAVLDIPFQVVAGGAEELGKAQQAAGSGRYGEAGLRTLVAAGRTGIGTAMMATPTGQALTVGGVALEQASPKAAEAVGKVLAPVTTITKPEGGITEPLAEIGDLLVQAILFKAGDVAGKKILGKMRSGERLTPQEESVVREARTEVETKQDVPGTPTAELPPSFRETVIKELGGKDVETRFGRLGQLSDADLIRVAKERGVRTEVPTGEIGAITKAGKPVTPPLETKPTGETVVKPAEVAEKAPAEGYADNLRLGRFLEEARPGVKELVAQERPSVIEEQRRGVRPHAVTEQAARTQVEVIERARRGEIKPGEAFNAEQLEALDSELNRIATMSADDAIRELGEDGLKNFLKTVHGAHAEAGRALNILGKEVDPSVVQNLIGLEKVTKDPELANALRETITRLEKREKVPPGLWDKVAEWGRNIKLASFSGLVRASVGNTVSQLFKYPEILVSGATNKMLSAITGKTRDRYARELVEDFVGTKAGLKDGFKRAADIILENPTALQESVFFQMEIGTGGGAIGGKFGKAVRTPQKLQGAIDAIFRVPSERGAIGRAAVRKAFQEGKTGEEWVRRVQELIEKPTPDMVAYAANDARYRTFQSELGTVGAGVNQLRMSHPTVQLVVTFYSTPTNLFKQLVERTPLAVITPSFQQALAEAFAKPGLKKTPYQLGLERITGRKFTPQIGELSDKVARVLTGTTFITATGLVVSKILDGEITGRGPKSREERDALMRTGWQPYSVRIGDTYISYRGFEPLSGWLSLLADINDGYREEGLSNSIKRATANIIRNFAENPFLIGLKDVLEAMTDPDETSTDKMIAGFAAGMVVPTIVQQTARIIDPTVRKPEGVAEQIQSRIPFASKSLLPRRNVFGEPIEIERPATRLVAASTSTRKVDEVETELQRLKLNLSWPSETYAGIKLTPEQHDKLVEIAGKEFKRGLTAMVKSPAYQALPDGMKESAIRRLQDNIREVQRLILFPEVRMQGFIQRADKDLTGGIIKPEEKEKVLEALRKAVGQ